MRKLWFVSGVAVLVAAYWCWPYLGAYQIARAAEQKDATVFAERVDFPAVRKSVAKQIIRTYLRQSGRGDKLGAYGRGVAISVGTTVADPYLTELLNPQSLTTLLSDGHVAPIKVEDRTIDFDWTTPGLPEKLRSEVASIFFSSTYNGLTSFLLHIPDNSDAANDFDIQLHLRGATWQVSGIGLPSRLLNRIADDIIAQEKARPKA